MQTIEVNSLSEASNYCLRTTSTDAIKAKNLPNTTRLTYAIYLESLTVFFLPCGCL